MSRTEHLEAPSASSGRVAKSPPPAHPPHPRPPRRVRRAHPDVQEWLHLSHAAFLKEGFQRDVKQFWKRGQIWGVIRQEPDDLQLHIRAFRDGRLEAELELSNKYVQHLWSHRRNAAPEVQEILEKHGLPTKHVHHAFVPRTGAHSTKVMPKGRTKNHHAFAMFAAAGIAVAALLLGHRSSKLLRRR